MFASYFFCLVFVFSCTDQPLSSSLFVLKFFIFGLFLSCFIFHQQKKYRHSTKEKERHVSNTDAEKKKNIPPPNG